MVEEKEVAVIDLNLTKNEQKLLKTVLIVEQDLVDKIDRATLEGDKYAIKFSYDELDELVGYVATEANRAKLRSREDKLDRLCDKIETLLENYQKGKETK